jgi:PAS domain S-box-containing protein
MEEPGRSHPSSSDGEPCPDGPTTAEDERGSLEAQFRERTNFAETVIANAGEGVIVYDRELRYLVWNPAMEEMTGLKAGEVLGRRPADLFPERAAAGIGRTMRRVLDAGAPQTSEFWFTISATGHSAWVSGTYRPYRDAAGQIIGIIGFVRDITAEHEAREALKRSEEQLQTIFDSLGDGVAIHDVAGRFLETNRSMCDLLGYSHDELLSMTLSAVSPPETASLIPERIARVMEGGVYVFESARLRRDGSRVPIETSARRIQFRGEEAILSVQRDISERKRAEEEIKRGRALLRSIVDSTPDAIYLKDAAGRYLLLNRAAEAFVGRPASEVLGHDDTFIFPAEEAAVVMETDRRAIGAPAPITLEERVTSANGRVATFLSTKGPVRADDGTPIGLFGIARDVTERTRIQAALELSEAKFSTAFTTSPDAVNLNRLSDGIYLDISDGFTATTGFTRADVKGRTSAEIAIWADPGSRDELVARLLADGVVHNMEMRFRRKDGSLGTGLMSARVIPIDGQPCILSITRDITDRKLAESRFRNVFDFARDPMFIHDLEGRFIEVNRTACESLGYSRDELLTMSLADIDTPEYRPLARAWIEALLRDGSAFFETAHLRRDGTAIPVEVSATVIDLGDSEAIMSIARDVSEQRRAEAERMALEEQLRQAQKMEGIGRLAGGVAHDFNNLLTIIRGNASLILAEMAPGEGPREDLEQIEQAADRAAALTRQLLTFARRSVARPEAIDLGAIVRRLEPMLHRLVREDIKLVTLTPQETGAVMADPGQIEQVIVNLVVNASDAMPDGGTLTIETASGISADGRMVSLSVSDTGVGIDDETMDHLFEPFFTTKEPGKGTGLGLATVYGIVHGSGGTVTVSTKLGRGSTFTVHLPWLESTPRNTDAATPEPEAVRARAGTILVVEDDPGVERLARRVLEAAGYRVLSFPDGATAIAAARDEPLQLLLTDVVMPGLRGREVAAALAAAKPGIRVLYMSGHTDEGFAPDGILEPGVEFLGKPFTADQLLQAVDRALACDP